VRKNSRQKIITILIFAWLIVLSGLRAQSIIENREKPLNKNAGRVVKLKEEWRLRDNQVDFYFKNPTNLKVAGDGHIFCLDENQLLEFDGDGRFQRNLFRSGQGPGEVTRIENYLVTQNEVIMHQSSPNKFVIVNRQANLIRDFKPVEATPRLLAVFGDKYLMAQHAFPQIDKIRKEEGEVLEVNWNLGLVDWQGKVEKIDGFYPTQWFFKRLPTAVIADYLTEIIGDSFQEKYFVFSHTGDYRIKVFDMEKRKVSLVFKRKYHRVRYEPEKPPDERPGMKRLELPRDYHNDVLKIITQGNKILVFTSTLDPKRGFLIDVFDEKGIYLDNFYLPLQIRIRLTELARYPLDIEEDHLLLIEKEETGIIFLVKYKIFY